MRGYDLQITYGLKKSESSCGETGVPIPQAWPRLITPREFLEHQTSVKRLRMVSVAGEGVMERISDKVVRHRR